MGENQRGLSANSAGSAGSVKAENERGAASPKTAGSEQEWIELLPYGVTVSLDRSRPIMLFKSEDGEEVLPVWLSPLEVGIALTQNQRLTSNVSPHDVTAMVLQNQGLKLERCDFVEVRGHHQFVDLHFSGSPGLTHLRVRADQAVSLCLHQKVRFYSLAEVIQDSRVQHLETFQLMGDDVGGDEPPYFQ